MHHKYQLSVSIPVLVRGLGVAIP